MKNIIAFGASSSTTSVNQKLAVWSANQLNGVQVTTLDLNDFEMPIYSMDKEIAGGVPELAKAFKKHVEDADGILISFAEHNGSYATAFKNVFDWISRLGAPIWSNKPMILMSTSPGPRGGATVLAAATGSFPHQGGKIASSFSLPSFHQNFDAESGIKNAELREAFNVALNTFKEAI